jgi:hypothetical protein
MTRLNIARLTLSRLSKLLVYPDLFPAPLFLIVSYGNNGAYAALLQAWSSLAKVQMLVIERTTREQRSMKTKSPAGGVV